MAKEDFSSSVRSLMSEPDTSGRYRGGGVQHEKSIRRHSSALDKSENRPGGVASSRRTSSSGSLAPPNPHRKNRHGLSLLRAPKRVSFIPRLFKGSRNSTQSEKRRGSGKSTSNSEFVSAGDREEGSLRDLTGVDEAGATVTPAARNSSEGKATTFAGSVVGTARTVVTVGGLLEPQNWKKDNIHMSNVAEAVVDTARSVVTVGGLLDPQSWKKDSSHSFGRKDSSNRSGSKSFEQEDEDSKEEDEDEDQFDVGGDTFKPPGLSGYQQPAQSTDASRGYLERNMSRRARKTFRAMSGEGKATAGNISPFQLQMMVINSKNKSQAQYNNNAVNQLRDNAKFHYHSPFGSADAMEKKVSMQIEDSLSSAVLKSLSNSRLCDVQIVGKDDVPVDAPSYLLAIHSEIFEEMLYGGDTQQQKQEQGENANDDDDTSFDTGHSFNTAQTQEQNQTTIRVLFAEWDALEATMHFLSTRSLPDGIESVANEPNLRTVCQIYLLGRIYKINSLAEQAYRTARRHMNKTPKLVCAAFDECILTRELLARQEKREKGKHQQQLLKSSFTSRPEKDELKDYALE